MFYQKYTFLTQVISDKDKNKNSTKNVKNKSNKFALITK